MRRKLTSNSSQRDGAALALAAAASDGTVGATERVRRRAVEDNIVVLLGWEGESFSY